MDLDQTKLMLEGLKRPYYVSEIGLKQEYLQIRKLKNVIKERRVQHVMQKDLLQKKLRLKRLELVLEKEFIGET